MTVALSCFALLFLSSAAFFHASSKRSWFKHLRESTNARRIAKLAGWALLGLALVLISVAWGWAKGVSAWFALLFLAGIASLLIATLFNRAHLPAGFVMLVAAAGTKAIAPE